MSNINNSPPPPPVVASPAAQSIHFGPPKGQQRLLLPWLTDAQLAMYVQPPALPLAAIARATAQAKLAQSAHTTLAASFRPFTGPAAAYAAKIATTPAFQAAFPGQSVEFGWISVAELITFQPCITGTEGLMPMAEEELLAWCLPETFSTQCQLTCTSNVANRWDVLIETHDPNANFAVGAGPGGIVMGPQPRANWVQVVSSGGLSLVVNGNHRVSFLTGAGVTEIPVMRRQLPSLAEVIPKEPAVFTYDQIIARRPPLVCDFVDASLAYDVPLAPRRRIMQVRVELTEHRLP
jgi:hypothetical protein